MAKSSKKSTSTKRARSNSSQKGSNRMFKDGLSFASGLFESQKNSGAEKISELASATQEYAASMKDIPAFEETISYAGEVMETVADYISNNSVERIVRDATGYVKRYPIAIVAGATLGVIAIVAAQTSWQRSPSTGNMRRSKASGRSMGVPVKGKINRQTGSGANLH